MLGKWLGISDGLGAQFVFVRVNKSTTGSDLKLILYYNILHNG